MNLLHRPRSLYVTRNLNLLDDEQATLGERLAGSLAHIGGSWTFVVGFFAAFAAWVGLNSLQLLFAPFDPYPFVCLNLLISCLAAVQAPVILMSQNRQAARDRLAADLEYASNLKTEMELEHLHEKLDLLREQQWLDLVELQQHQIMLLNQILEGQGLNTLPPLDPTTPRGYSGERNDNGALPPVNLSRAPRRRQPRQVRLVPEHPLQHRDSCWNGALATEG